MKHCNVWPVLLLLWVVKSMRLLSGFEVFVNSCCIQVVIYEIPQTILWQVWMRVFNFCFLRNHGLEWEKKYDRHINHKQFI